MHHICVVNILGIFQPPDIQASLYQGIAMYINPPSSSARKRVEHRFHMPEEIQHLGEMPLFRAVAWWGFLHKKEFSRNDVSKAFHIDLRRASGILHYLCHRHDKRDIEFSVRKATVRDGHCQLLVKIHSLASAGNSTAPLAKAQPATCQGNKHSATDDRRLSRWLLSRPTGNNEAKLAAWKAACPLSE